MAQVKPKKGKKAPASGQALKHHWKSPGFNAFGAHSARTKKRVYGHIGTNGKAAVAKFVRCTEAVAPEGGIHSLAWANAIAPQDCHLLKIPIEIRFKIWTLVISEMGGGLPIKPMKKGNIFFSHNWQEAARDTIAMSETCRQIYVDVVGSGLLYKTKQFSFTSGLLLNYLWVINPAHKNSLRSVHLPINVDCGHLAALARGRAVPAVRSHLPTKAFATLAECTGLRDLHLEFRVDYHLCLHIHHRNRYHRRERVQGSEEYPLHNDRKVPYDIIARVRKCTSLRKIKNLQTLWLDFHTYDEQPTGQIDLLGRPIFLPHQKIQLSGGGSGPYHELEEELKKVMLAQKK